MEFQVDAHGVVLSCAQSGCEQQTVAQQFTCGQFSAQTNTQVAIQKVVGQRSTTCPAMASARPMAASRGLGRETYLLRAPFWAILVRAPKRK